MNARLEKRSRVLLFTGDGKGKSTAAFGMVLRAAGHGMQACVVQFLKSRSDTGEVQALRQFSTVEVLQCGLGFVPSPADEVEYARHRDAAEAGLRLAMDRLLNPCWNVVVLDEICGAVHRGLLAEGSVVDVVQAALPGKIIVLTGRAAGSGLIDLADTVSRIECEKHGMAAGWKAQPGVEC